MVTFIHCKCLCLQSNITFCDFSAVSKHFRIAVNLNTNCVCLYLLFCYLFRVVSVLLWLKAIRKRITYFSLYSQYIQFRVKVASCILLDSNFERFTYFVCQNPPKRLVLLANPNKKFINTRQRGNYSDVLPITAARRDSSSNLTSFGAPNLSCIQT